MESNIFENNADNNVIHGRSNYNGDFIIASNLIGKVQMVAIKTTIHDMKREINTLHNDLNIYSHQDKIDVIQSGAKKNIAFMDRNIFNTIKSGNEMAIYISWEILVKTYLQFMIFLNVIQVFYGVTNNSMNMQLLYAVSQRICIYILRHGTEGELITQAINYYYFVLQTYSLLIQLLIFFYVFNVIINWSYLCAQIQICTVMIILNNYNDWNKWSNIELYH